jgi:hypothetical protein
MTRWPGLRCDKLPTSVVLATATTIILYASDTVVDVTTDQKHAKEITKALVFC